MSEQIGRIYVTGAAGLIGSNVVRALLAAGRQVVGIDNFWRGTQANVREFAGEANFTFRHADLSSDQSWYEDMRESDAVVHIADIVAGIAYVFSNEWAIFQRNLLINTAVARVVAQKRPARLIYLGTACSYPQGMQRSVTTSVLSERDKFPADPESGYGWSKLIGEIEFRLVTKAGPTRLVVLDLHNVYGWPCAYRDSTAQVIPSLINRALSSADGTLSVWGDGKQGRAFLHVSDVVSAIELALAYNGAHSAFMIGPEACTTIAEVVQIIRAHPKVRIDRVLYDVSKPVGDIGRFADPRLARTELGWSLRMDLVSGIHDLVDRIVHDRS